jgi:hypothetical protein
VQNLVSRTKGRILIESEKRVLKGIRGKKWQEAGEDCIKKNFIFSML